LFLSRELGTTTVECRSGCDMAKIFLVEDDPEISDNVKDWLQACENHIVETSANGHEGLEHLRFYNYDLIILDWDLPQMTGLDLCNEFRKRGGNTPILFLTGKRELINKEAGLDAGADDYLTKPFNVRELAARVRALLRRPPSVMKGSGLQCRHVALDPNAAHVTSAGKEIKLNAKEYALLEFFLRHPGQLFTAEALLDRVWKTDSDSTTEAITTTIKRLRKKMDIEGKPSIITTVHGLGYRLEENE
jgi:OmpR-family two-component system manganese-sensing response regulator